MTLADLHPGQRAVIHSIKAAESGIERLMTLGLVEGTPVSFLSSAIGGDPIEVGVFGVSVSLRRDQARCFSVATDD